MLEGPLVQLHHGLVRTKEQTDLLANSDPPKSDSVSSSRVRPAHNNFNTAQLRRSATLWRNPNRTHPHPPSSPQAGVSWHARLGFIRLAIRSDARGRGMITINDTIVVRRSAFVPYSGWSNAGETRTRLISKSWVEVPNRPLPVRPDRPMHGPNVKLNRV